MKFSVYDNNFFKHKIVNKFGYYCEIIYSYLILITLFEVGTDS